MPAPTSVIRVHFDPLGLGWVANEHVGKLFGVARLGGMMAHEDLDTRLDRSIDLWSEQLGHNPAEHTPVVFDGDGFLKPLDGANDERSIPVGTLHTHDLFYRYPRHRVLLLLT